MPEARRKREIPESENPIATDERQQISADAVLSEFEQICLAMSASGAVVAMRDLKGVRCVVSFGNAPAVGTRLQPNSAFTTECIENGEVVLCEDTKNDPRIQPAIAESLNLRSAVAVPIQAQGSVVGLIEVFCSQPSSIYPTAVTALKHVAKSFAGIMVEPSNSAHPIASGSVMSLEEAVGPPLAVESPVNQPRPEMDTTQDRSSVSRRPAIEQDSASLATPGAEGTEQLEGPTPFEIGASGYYRPRGNLQRARLWLVGATFALFLALLFLFIGPTHKRAGQISGNNAVSPASDRARTDEARKGSTAVQRGEKVRAPSSNGSEPAAPPEVAPPEDYTTASKPHKMQGKLDAADISIPGAIPADNETIRSNVSSREDDVRHEPSRELKSPSPVGRQPDRARSSASLLEAPEFGPALPTDTARADILGATPVLATPINPRITPNFVLDRALKGHSDWVTAVAFTSSGVLASGSWDESVRFWDVATGRELQALRDNTKQVQALAFSRDGRWLAAENSADAVTVWDATTGKRIRTLASEKPVPAVGTSWVYSIAFSPDSRWLASGVDEKTVRIWEMSTGRKLRDLTASRRSVIYIAFSPDGRLVASGNDDKTIQIWDASTGSEIRVLSGHRKSIYAAAFSPNGRWLASASGDKTVKIWDVATGREVRNLPGHQNAVTSLAFSPDGRWLASGSWDKTVKLWDMVTGNELQTLGAKAHSIYTVAFDSTGHWLASGSEDGTVNLWRLSDAVNRPGLRTGP